MIALWLTVTDATNFDLATLNAKLATMFTRVQALNFRCLRYVDQSLGRFATLVGPNASGKTTFLDVIALLGDLMRNSGKLADTLIDRSADFEKLLWLGEGDGFELAVEARIPKGVLASMAEELHQYSRVRYELGVELDRRANLIVLNHESLWLVNGNDKVGNGRRAELFPFVPDSPESLFLKAGKGRKMIISNKPDGNANYYADGKKSNRRVPSDASACARS